MPRINPKVICHKLIIDPWEKLMEEEKAKLRMPISLPRGNEENLEGKIYRRNPIHHLVGKCGDGEKVLRQMEDGH